MFRDTCWVIKSLLENKSFMMSKHLDVSLDNSEAKGNLFWKTKVKVDKEKPFYLEHLKSICLSIGSANGEGLWVKINYEECEIVFS